MKFFRLSSIMAVALFCVFAVSCENEEDDDTKSYLSGSIKLSFPAYVTPGTAKQFKIDTLSTLYREDEKPIGYYVNNPTTGVYDTLVFDGGVANPDFPDGVYTFKAPSKLGSYSLIIYGYSEDYYSSSASASFYVVDPRMDGTGSITGFSILPEDGLYVDTRDAKRYYTTKAAGLEWMRQNLAWTGAGVPYAKAEAMSAILGRYYSWEEAQKACPSGWRLPTDEEFIALAQAGGGTLSSSNRDVLGCAGAMMEDISFNEEVMWEYWPAVPKTNLLRFSAIPSGYALCPDGSPSFTGFSYYAAFWTSDQAEENGVYRYMYVDKNNLYRGNGDKNSLILSVRCVR